MRVTIAAVVCLVALMHADSASASEGGVRAIGASLCGEPARLIEVVLPGEAIGGEREGTEESNTLWCVSPDDPRCAPLESGSSQSVSFARAKLGCAATDWELALKLRELAANGGTTDYRGSARDGVLGRLERPPNSASR
jgi:hypothetical protein